MSQTGLNLSHAGAGLPADTVAAWGAQVTRLPLHAERDARPNIERLQAQGIEAWPIFVREAFEVRGQIVKTMESYRDELGDIVTTWQVCNEPDGTHAGEGASWVMSQGELNVWLGEARSLFPRPRYTLLGPGLVSGVADWLHGVRLDLVDAVCPHPYAKFPYTAELHAMLIRYRSWGKALRITEYDSRVSGMGAYLADFPGVEAALVFCGPSYLDFGLVDHPRALAEFLELTGGGTPVPEYSYVQGFEQMWRSAPDIIGSPIENESGLWLNSSMQRTTGGLLVWGDYRSSGSQHAFFHNDGTRYRWDGSRLVRVGGQKAATIAPPELENPEQERLAIRAELAQIKAAYAEHADRERALEPDDPHAPEAQEMRTAPNLGEQAPEAGDIRPGPNLTAQAHNAVVCAMGERAPEAVG